MSKTSNESEIKRQRVIEELNAIFKDVQKLEEELVCVEQDIKEQLDREVLGKLTKEEQLIYHAITDPRMENLRQHVFDKLKVSRGDDIYKRVMALYEGNAKDFTEKNDE